ncbi:xylulokinase [Haloferula sp.]|uniref:xylulokinase n=1 Tax=Haloferula sp. TaxID=2497595 RepID=UPI00329EB7FB
MYFLGIDIGHESTRVVALDLEAATLTEEATAPHEWIEGLPEGYREQDPAVWIGAVDHAVKELLAGLGDRRAEVVAVGITAPEGGMVVLDEANRIVRPAKLGTDRSAQQQVEEFGRAFGASPGLVELTGNALDAGSLGAQALWLKRHEPNHFQRATSLMTPQDFIGYWLTGVLGTSESTAATTGLFTIPRRIWSEELVEFVDGRLAGMLPPTIEPGRPRGILRNDLARSWGLPETVLVASGSSRESASIFAAGAALPGHVVADLSGDGALVAIVKGCVVDYLGEGSVGCDLAGNGFTRMPMNNVVAARELVRRHYGWSEVDEEAALASTQPGADGLLFLPYLLGESVPNLTDGTGVLHGMTLNNFTPANLARAAAEGVALGFGYAMSRLSELGCEPSTVRVTKDAGPRMNQLLADVFGVPVAPVSGSGGPLLGGLMQAAVAFFRENGEELGFDEISGYIVKVDDDVRCHPNPGRHEFYQKLLARRQYLVETLRVGGFL